MLNFEWSDFAPVDFQKLRNARDQYHHAVQSVSLVGRRFIPEGTDKRSTMTWVPGLSRLAGKWVKGEKAFRSSICFESFSLLLVDEKVNTLATFDLNGKTYLQGMVWLEGQIAKLGLEATKLQIKLPYEIPPYPTVGNTAFNVDLEMSRELAKYYHNSYISIKDIKNEREIEEPIVAWPRDFDQVLKIIVKDSGDAETSSKVFLGMSPGDGIFQTPFFYVNTWPFVQVEKCKGLSNGGMWVSDEWTGAVLKVDSLLSARGKQKEILNQFYREATAQLEDLLTQ